MTRSGESSVAVSEEQSGREQRSGKVASRKRKRSDGASSSRHAHLPQRAIQRKVDAGEAFVDPDGVCISTTELIACEVGT